MTLIHTGILCNPRLHMHTRAYDQQVVRSIRIFRIIRIFRRFKTLQNIVVAISRCVLKICHTFLITAIVVAIYSVMATQCFGWIDHSLFGTFSSSFVTMFQARHFEGLKLAQSVSNITCHRPQYRIFDGLVWKPHHLLPKPSKPQPDVVLKQISQSTLIFDGQPGDDGRRLDDGYRKVRLAKFAHSWTILSKSYDHVSECRSLMNIAPVWLILQAARR